MAVLAVLALLLFSDAWGQSDNAESANEYRVKAAFLLNFIKFSEWPAEAFATPSEKIRIGICGENPLDTGFSADLTARIINGRGVVIIVAEDTVAIATCHVLFVPSSQEKLAETLPQLATLHHILTVGESDGFATRGGMIGFVQENNRLRFEINLEAAGRADIHISSQVLRLASKVIR